MKPNMSSTDEPASPTPAPIYDYSQHSIRFLVRLAASFWPLPRPTARPAIGILVIFRRRSPIHPSAPGSYTAGQYVEFLANY